MQTINQISIGFFGWVLFVCVFAFVWQITIQTIIGMVQGKKYGRQTNRGLHIRINGLIIFIQRNVRRLKSNYDPRMEDWIRKMEERHQR